jgi:hypothetical protein
METNRILTSLTKFQCRVSVSKNKHSWIEIQEIVYLMHVTII